MIDLSIDYIIGEELKNINNKRLYCRVCGKLLAVRIYECRECDIQWDNLTTSMAQYIRGLVQDGIRDPEEIKLKVVFRKLDGGFNED